MAYSVFLDYKAEVVEGTGGSRADNYKRYLEAHGWDGSINDMHSNVVLS